MAFAQRPSRSGSGRGAGGRRRSAAGGLSGGAGSSAEPPADRPPEPEADPESVARRICLHLLEHAPRTRAELAGKLAAKGVPDDVAETVLGRFTEVGLIDDAAFAEAWVTTRHRGRGLARRALSQELRRKGVEDDVAAEAVEGLDPELELATARSLVDRRLRTTAGLTTDARVRRLAGMLARKGYPAGVAFRVVREALAAEGEEAELAFDDLQALEE